MAKVINEDEEARAAAAMLDDDVSEIADRADAVEAAGEERLHPILSNADVLAARAKALKNVTADRHKAAMEAVVAEETERLKREDGLTTGTSYLDEIVDFTVDLPPYADKIMVNGPLGFHYAHGKTYPVPRHVANSLAETLDRARHHEDQTEGKSIVQSYQRKRDTAINARTGAVVNAPVYG